MAEEKGYTGWGIAPWQTPTGEGWRAPWSPKVTPTVFSPNDFFEIDQDYEGLWPGEYWDMLQNYLDWQVATGKIEAQDAETLKANARTALENRQWGVGLPLYTEINKSYLSNLTTQQRALALEEDTTMDDFQKAQVERWTALDEQAKEKTDIAQAQWEKEFQAQQTYRQWQMQQTPANEKALKQRLWEAEQLTKLAGPADWIKRWELIQGRQRRQEKAGLERGITRAEEMIERAPEVPLRGIPRQEGEVTTQTGATPTPNLAKKIEKLSRQLEAVELEADGEGRGATGPPAPSWLPQFVPSQTAGQPITRAPIRTPSGQQWMRTPPSELAGLKGYTEWAGYRPLGDIYAHMEMMQPQAPAGGGMRRWRPAQQ